MKSFSYKQLKSQVKLDKFFYSLAFKTNVTKVRKVDPFSGSEVVKSHPQANPNRLKGKYAIITGGSNGVGKATCELFAESGVEGLTISDLDEKRGKELAERLNAEQKKQFAYFIQSDVSCEKSVSMLMTKHMQRHGKLNVLFNNAGIMMNNDDCPVTTPIDTWTKTMNVNALGVFLCCKYGIPEMLKSNGGSIINVASIVAMIGSATAQVAYTASKGAVLSMTKEMAIIYARDNIRINALCPGPLSTELLKGWLNTDEKLDRRLIHNPIGRFGHAKEIAQAVTFLASNESSLMTASQFVIDGGLTSAYITPE